MQDKPNLHLHCKKEGFPATWISLIFWQGVTYTGKLDICGIICARGGDGMYATATGAFAHKGSH